MYLSNAHEQIWFSCHRKKTLLIKCKQKWTPTTIISISNLTMAQLTATHMCQLTTRAERQLHVYHSHATIALVVGNGERFNMKIT